MLTTVCTAKHEALFSEASSLSFHLIQKCLSELEKDNFLKNKNANTFDHCFMPGSILNIPYISIDLSLILTHENGFIDVVTVYTPPLLYPFISR